jgi:hypothetical protein
LEYFSIVNRFGSEDQQQTHDVIKEEEIIVQEKEEPEEAQVSHTVVNFNYLDLFFCRIGKKLRKDVDVN